MAILKTERLTLRPITLDDLQHMVDTIMSDREVMAWLPYSHAAATPEGQQEVAAGYLADFTSVWQEGYGVWAICRNDSGPDEAGPFIGYCGFLKGQLDGEGPEIAYALGKAHWGRGFIPEALNACLDWLFNSTEVSSVYAVTDRTNKASLRVMEKIGMRHTRDVDLYQPKDGRLLPCFTLSRSDVPNA